MTVIRVVGWKVGFDKIEMNRILRRDFSFSLDEAKRAVDSILEGNIIELRIATEEAGGAAEALRSIGAEFEVLP